MKDSIFTDYHVNKDQGAWVDQLWQLTPIEARGNLLYKREDYFAPLGYGGINGAKLRQLIWLVDNYHKAGGRAGLITGASILSPQLSMAALVAKHYNLPSVMVLGGTKPETALLKENVAIAHAAGAEFQFTPVGYNPSIQNSVKNLHENIYHGYYRLNYGITTPADCQPEDIEGFHRVGAEQVRNIPDHVHTIVAPMGSANSCTSLLYGIAKYRPKGLKRILLIGIGPTRLEWVEDRLTKIEQVTGLTITKLFKRDYVDHPQLSDQLNNNTSNDAPYTLEHHDLHATKKVAYQDKRPWTQDGITFHPTYEGKVMTYLNENRHHFDWFWNANQDVLFWIIGSTPTAQAMKHYL
jgi:1-aminocyclopropane-1-carboxylate deaminase/D-cysteine desulfhydrase-like pyridoxal-dependent ACC family enzyme